MNRSLNVCAPGYWDWMDSYGLIACQLARQLAGMGWRTNAYALGSTRFANQPPDVAAITAQPRVPTLGGLFLGYPTSYHKHGALFSAGPRVAVTMFESSKLPAGWAEILNQMDAVITPSWFCWEVFQAAGVTAQLHVVPLGLSEVYQPAPRLLDRPLTFLAFLDRGRRKGGLVALQAFLKAFGDDPNYRLVLKSRDPRVKVDLVNDNITVIQQDMSEAELYQLYLDCDVLISPTRGEGFGLIPREFAATGGLALATGWGGTADDIQRWGYPLPYTLVSADWRGIEALEGQDLGLWAEPDIDGIAGILKRVAEFRQAYQGEALLTARSLHDAYNWPNFAAEVLAIYRKAAEAWQPRVNAPGFVTTSAQPVSA